MSTVSLPKYIWIGRDSVHLDWNLPTCIPLNVYNRLERLWMMVVQGWTQRLFDAAKCARFLQSLARQVDFFPDSNVTLHWHKTTHGTISSVHSTLSLADALLSLRDHEIDTLSLVKLAFVLGIELEWYSAHFQLLDLCATTPDLKQDLVASMTLARRIHLLAL
jgi:hypothetical protein